MTTLGLVQDAGDGRPGRAHRPAAAARMTAPASGRDPAVRRNGARGGCARRWRPRTRRPRLASPEAAPPLRGTTTADVAIVGGGYTGLWTAIASTEQAPGARIVLLEADICGGGPSGRNGGFATGWWDELPTLIERHGRAGGRRRPGDRRGGRRDRRVVRRATAWTPGTRSAARCRSAPRRPRTTSWQEAVEACRDAGFGDRYVALDPAAVQAHVRRP